jgi:predicted MFS family arabinose efflux permease
LSQGWSFFQRTFYYPWIIGLIAAQKLTDNLIRSMWHPYLVSIGIDKSDIVRIDKGYGLVMAMVGIQCGVWLISRYHVRFALRLWVMLQAMMMGILAVMSMLVAHSFFNALFVMATLGYHLIGSLGHMSMLAYLSGLSKGGSANDDVHHAMLTSCGALGRTVVSWAAASLASQMDWPCYFACALVLCLPAFVLTGTVWPFVRRDTPRR